MIARKPKRSYAELEREVKDLKRALSEAHEQQTATAEILRIISSSPTDTQPVFDAIAKSGVRLFGGLDMSLRLVNGDRIEQVANTRSPDRFAVPVNDESFPPARAILRGETVHIADISAEDWVNEEARRRAKRRGFRAVAVAPMLRGNDAIGVIAVNRATPGLFTEKQIALLKTFADQAVIAIENVRLFNETKEALEQQTATAEILRVISESPTDVMPVLEAVAHRAAQLCEAPDARIFLVENDTLNYVTGFGELKGVVPSQPLTMGNPIGRAIRERSVVHIEDLAAALDEFPWAREAQRTFGTRTVLAVPLLRENKALGTILLRRREVRPFSAKQIELVKLFADQATIAIENVRLFNETKEALEQQTATAEILKVISSSPTDVQPVFDAIVKSGLHLFRGLDVSLRLVKGDQTEMVACTMPARGPRIPLSHEGFNSSRAIRSREVVQVPDVFAEEWVGTPFRQRAEQRGARAIVSAPMLRETNAIGAISVSRATPGAFTEKEIALLLTFADQAVIAIENVRLFKELEARNRELTESLEHQTATSDILRIISSSPTDTQPVFDAIVKSGVRLFGGQDVSLRLVKGDQTEVAASTSPLGVGDDSLAPLNEERFPTSRAIQRREAVQVPDLFAEDWVSERLKRRADQMGFRAILSAPMLRENTAIGAIAVSRATPGLFTEKQVALLKTFADQAVIAIENVRLFKELQARNGELSESLEQQTATSEILRIISSSPTDTQPVFDAIVQSGVHLFGGLNVTLRLIRDDQVELVASTLPVHDDGGYVPLNDDRYVASRTILRREAVHVPDVFSEDWVGDGMKRLAAHRGFRAILSAPLLREGNVIGIIAVSRATPGRFTDKQVALLKTFADQAVIAIENVRLFKELQARNAEITEALEQQTATAEILKVISSSPTDLKPVFDAILENATRLCDAHMANLALYDGDTYLTVAQRGGSAEYAEWVTNSGPIRIIAGTNVARMIAERRPIHVADVRDSSVYRDRTAPGLVALVELGGARSEVLVPMLKEGRVVGRITIYRPEVRPFTQKQIDLVSTFASQAVIAIENVRLFNETKEALEQQTVISEILRVISSSPTDVQPVFEAIVNSGAHLFSGIYEVSLRLVKGDLVETVASTLPIHDTGGANPAQLDDESAPAPRALRRREVVQIPDILAAEEWVGARAKQRAGQRGWRALLAAPMLRENNAIGVIAVTRVTPGPFTDKQIALVKTFADQAVIAIENVRLFKELQARNAEVTEALEQQTVTADILKVISSSPTDTQPVFDAIVRSGVHLFGGMNMSLRLVKGEHTEPVASTIPLRDADKYPVALSDDGSPSAQAIRRREVVQVPDLFAEEWVSEPAKQRAKRRGFRAIVSAPMLRENTAIGVINVLRAAPGPFTDKHIALLKTFTDQAVIAIENVRLFNETKEALEQQTVISEILRVISSSPTDVQPVFDAIVKSGVHLFGGMNVSLRLVKGDHSETVASTLSIHDTGAFPAPLDDEGTPTHRAILRREIVQVPDMLAAEEWVSPRARQRAEQRGFRALMSAPMLRENNAIGTINVSRATPGPFTDKQVALLKTFADQAVIAIENVRLFKELQARNAEVTEALEQQTATAEILRIISTTPTDVTPVLEAVADSAARLCDAADVIIRRVDGDVLTLAAHIGPVPVGQDTAPAISRRTFMCRAVRECRTIHVPDVREPHVREEYPDSVEFRAAGLYRTILVTPLMREDTAIGAIVLRRPETRPFSEKQVKLLETFAAQAVIAIENVRLFKELQAKNAEVTEALEQQTATSEILSVISQSPTDVAPVFETIMKNAARLCGGPIAGIYRFDGELVHLVATHNWPPEAAGLTSRYPCPPSPALMGGRIVLAKSIVCVPDALADPDYDKSFAAMGHWRRMVGVPLMRGETPIGAFAVAWPDPGETPESQVALLKTFADQAVIAIENVRLFKELQARNAEIMEALEQQTATSEVLKVISRSTFDLDPVLETLVENARKLCNADGGVISRKDKDGNYVFVIERGLSESPELLAYTRRRPIRPDRGSAVGRAVLERRPVHIPDVLADPAYTRADLAELRGFRTVLAVPMLREGEPVGVFVLTRTKEVRPFTDKQIELVTTFADQAVIAIENVRLFNEIQDKSRQLEIANRHKSQFLANMSHELRTPLNCINGFSEMLLARMFGDINEKQEEFLRDINSSGQHLLSLINDVLDLSKIEAGRMELHLTAFDPGATLDNTVMLVKERASRRGITVSLEADERLDRWVGDERKIRQVMLNLLSNAVKFTPEGGRIDVRARRDGDEMVVAVSDTGVGIRPEDQARIFEEFQQAGTDYTKKAEGTGLGLALSRKFVELHGGTLKVESAEGKGSTFTFTLPEMQEATV